MDLIITHISTHRITGIWIYLYLHLNSITNNNNEVIHKEPSSKTQHHFKRFVMCVNAPKASVTITFVLLIKTFI